MPDSNASQIDVSSFPTRIASALQGDTGGIEVSVLAWQYAAAVDQANKDLKECADLLGRGASIDAYVKLQQSPKLMDRVNALSFPELDDWNQCCASFGWKKSEGLKTSLIDCLESAFDEGDKLKSWLMSSYRERRSSKNPAAALRIIEVLVDQFPSDVGLQKECAQMQKKMKAQAEADLMAVTAGLLPDETVGSIIERYRDCGVELPESDPEVQAVLATEKEEKLNAGFAKIDSIIKKSAELSETNWADLEAEYLDCEHYLDEQNLRGAVKESYLEHLAQVKERLSFHRGAHDANLQLKDAIEVRDSAKGADLKVAKQNIARIRDGMSQCGFEISPELQNKLSKEGEKVKSKKSPKTAIIAGVGIAAAVAAAAGWFFLNEGSNSKPTIAKNKPAASVSKPAPAKSKQAPAKATPASKPSVAAKPAPKAKTGANPADDALASAPQTAAKPAEPEKTLSPEEALKEVQKKLDAEYEEVADKLESAVAKGYTPAIEEEVNKILEQVAEKEMVATDSDESKAIAQRIEELKTAFQSLKENRGEELITIAEYRKSQAETSVRTVEAAKLQSAFEDASEKADKAVSQAWKAIDNAKAIDSTYSGGSLKLAEDRLRKVQAKWASLIEAREQLASAKTLKDYIKPLQRIQTLDIATAPEKDAAARILALEPEFQNMLQKLIFPDSQKSWEAFTSIINYSEAAPALSFSERALAQKLLRSNSTSSVYVSKVQFYQGSSSPQSEKIVYLSKPIGKIGKDIKSGINHTFQEYGFDAAGKASETSRGMNILSRPGGVAFGFFYQPSVASPESEYFKKTIQPALNKIISGAPRFTAIELLETLNTADEISPSFRVYWKSQIISFIAKDPWKWGFQLSPSLQQEQAELKGFTRAGLNSRTWLSTAELKEPSKKYVDHLRKSAGRKPSEEAAAFASLLQVAARGELVPVGYADLSGKVHYASKIKAAERLWTFNGKTGQLEPLQRGAKLSVYTPVMTYRLKGQDASQVLSDSKKSSGLDLSKSPYNSLLPPLFAK